MSKTATKSPSTKEKSPSSRAYVDRLVLTALMEAQSVVKPGELTDRLSDSGVSTTTIRSVLSSNPDMFAYVDRKWIPAARAEAEEVPFAEAVRLYIASFQGPAPLSVVCEELSRLRGIAVEEVENIIRRYAAKDDWLLLTIGGDLYDSGTLFRGSSETVERAIGLYRVDEEVADEIEKKLGKFDWNHSEAIVKALEKVAPVSAKELGFVAWRALNPDDRSGFLLFNWKEFYGELLSIPGFVFSANGEIVSEKDVAALVKTVSKEAEKFEAVIELEDVAPLDLSKADMNELVKKVQANGETLTARIIAEEMFEITPASKSYQSDMKRLIESMQGDQRLVWVGGDRFRKAGDIPSYVNEIPEPFHFQKSDVIGEDGDPVDVLLSDQGLPDALRKLIMHPLANDVLDEELDQPEPKVMPKEMRMVLKPIHRDLGTFPMAQFLPGWLDNAPAIQELILVDPEGNELQAWVNHDTRLIYGLLDWWLDQPVESGAIFTIGKTDRPNVLTFTWDDQTDPITFISPQRMEQLREIAANSEGMTTFDLTREIMSHWPKGVDYLTLLWEVNVVRRTSRRLLASLLSGYQCFTQRSGSPVWHYEPKKVEQGFDKNKKKFIEKG